MLKVMVAGQDVTDMLREDKITVRSSSDFPYYADTKINNVRFVLVGPARDTFDPLNPNNFFATHWERPDGYNCPVEIESDGVSMFSGIIVDVNSTIVDGAASITVTDLSRDLRDAELTAEFGLDRSLDLGGPDGNRVYSLPSTAAPVHAGSVSAWLRRGSSDRQLHKVIALGTEGIELPTSYMVQSDAPALQLASDDDRQLIVRFREPYRWGRLDALVQKLVDNAGVGGIETDIGIQELEVEGDSPFATRGRVGWHVEGGELPEDRDTAPSTHSWGWTGYVRDFVVNPVNNDAFFLYGREGGRSSIIHYDFRNDTYKKYPFLRQYGTKHYTCWRIAANKDFTEFYIAACIPSPSNDYPSGGFYNAGYPEGNTTAQGEQLPRIVKWAFGDREDSENGWSLARDAYDDTHRPQIANYILTQNTIIRGSNIDDWWADTRRLFTSFTHNNNHYIVYIYQKSSGYNPIDRRITTPGEDGIAIYDTENATLTKIPSIIRSRTGLGGDYGISSDGRIFCLTFDSSNTLHIYSLNIGDTTPIFRLVRTHPNLPNQLNITDIVVDGSSYPYRIYGVIQDRSDLLDPTEKRKHPGYPYGRLVRIDVNADGTGEIEDIERYEYYISSARGGVRTDDGKVYYFEGGLDVYGNPSEFETHTKDQIASNAHFWEKTFFRALNPFFQDDAETVVVQPENYTRASGRLLEVSGVRIDTHNGFRWRSAYAEQDVQERLFTPHGVHTGIVAPLRHDGERVHMITGYGDIFKADAFPPMLERLYDEEGFLLEEPQNDLENWQWITFGKKQHLYIHRLETSENENVWGLLKQLAAIAYCRIGFDGNTFFFRSRIIPESPEIKKTYGNYGINDNLLDIDVKPTYTQIHNQIRGDITYLLADDLPATQDELEIIREVEDGDNPYDNSIAYKTGDVVFYNGDYWRYLKDAVAGSPPVPYPEDMWNVEKVNLLTVDKIGKKPLNVDMKLITHFQLWWAELLATYLLNDFSELRHDINIETIWDPERKIGNIVDFDVKAPIPEGDDKYKWIETVLKNAVKAEVISAEHVIGTGDNMWVTKCIARTFG